MRARVLSLVATIVCGVLTACAQMMESGEAGSDAEAAETGQVAEIDAAVDGSVDAHDAATSTGDATTDAGADATDSGADTATDAPEDAPKDAPPDVIEAGHDAGSLDTDLIGLWNLDETKAGTAPNGTDFADDSGQGDHGVASSSGVAFGVAGLLGDAVGLSGSGYIVLGASAPQPQGPMSASAWIKANTSQGPYPQIVTMGDSSGLTGYNLYLYSPSSQGVASFIVKEGSNGWGSCWAQGTTDLRDGAWHHLAGVYSGNDISIFVDGVLEASSTCANQAIDYGTSPSGEIGAKANGSTFAGSLDQVGVWNRALSSQEVSALYNGGTGTPLP